jgi:hypothetical protein
MPDDLLTTNEMSAYLFGAYKVRISPGALTTRRCIGADGPEFIRVGRAVFYRRSAGDDYAARVMSGPMRSTKDAATPAINGETVPA